MYYACDVVRRIDSRLRGVRSAIFSRATAAPKT